MPYSSGGEDASGNAKIEAVKQQRVAARLVGEFEWSIYQRAYDGVRVDAARRGWRASAVAFSPTQGGFEDAAGLMMPDVRVVGGVVVSGGPQDAAAEPRLPWHASPLVARFRHDTESAMRLLIP